MKRVAIRSKLPSWRAALLIAVGWLPFFPAEPARAGGLHHKGYYHQTTRIRSTAPVQTVNLAPVTSQHLMLSPVTTQHLMLSPVTTQVTGQTLQLTPSNVTGQTLQLTPSNVTGQTLQLTPSNVTGQTLQLTPSNVTGQTLQLAPNTLTLSPQTTYYVVGGTTAASTLKLSPQTNSAQPQTPSTGASDTDTAYQVLTLGFAGRMTMVQKFEQALKDKLSKLGGPNGPLNEQDLAHILLGTGKDFLRSNSFGIVIDDVLEPFLKKIVGKVIQDGQPAQPDKATDDDSSPLSPVPSGQKGTPAGSQTFDISGRIILTPISANGTGPAKVISPPTGQKNGSSITEDGNTAVSPIP